MEARKLEVKDLEPWAALRDQLWPSDPGEHLEELKAFFAGTSIDIVEVFGVDDAEGELAGFIELNIRNFAEGSRQPRVPYVEGWFVREECRGLGIGTLLMNHAEQWARKQGFSELASDAVIDNEYSIAMHNHLGFEEVDRVVCFLKSLE